MIVADVAFHYIKFVQSPLQSLLQEGAGPSTHGTRKIGRPVAYQGDPDSSSLTALERVQIKRRIINRESARRLRVRRQESLDVIQAEVGDKRLWNKL